MWERRRTERGAAGSARFLRGGGGDVPRLQPLRMAEPRFNNYFWPPPPTMPGQ
ncbi:zinc finger protein 362-like isoform X3, partial [Lates japonicus]